MMNLSVAHANAIGTLYWCEDGFWYGIFNEGVSVGAEELAEFLAYMSDADKPLSPLIVDQKFPYSSEIEAHQLLNDLLPRCVSAAANVCYTNTSKQIANIINKSILADMETAEFSRLEDAISWARTINHATQPHCVNTDLS